MADLHEYNFSVIEDKSSSDQKRNLSLRHVLCIPCRCCFAGSLHFSSSTVKPESNPLQFPRCFSLSYQKNFSRKTFSLNVCEATRRCKLQAPIKRGNFGAKLTHLWDFWLDVQFFSHAKKHRSRVRLDVLFFPHVKNIVRYSDWLELICLWNFTTQLGEYFSVCMYRGYYMAARGYEFYVRVLKVSLTSERNERVRDTFSTRR